jgi:histidinol-phosphate/aromatic aminotransferase/cobyric acid decarboxylase-like protein
MAQPAEPACSASTVDPGRNLPDLSKIDANENPYASEKAIQAIQRSFSQSSVTPATPGTPSRFVHHHQVDSGMLEVGYGSSELLKMAAKAFLGPGKNVVTAQPTYGRPARYGSVYDATAFASTRLTVQP